MVTAYGAWRVWGRVPLPPIPTCPHPPGAMEEAQGDAHSTQLTGTGVGSTFRFVSDLEWQPALP